MMKNILTVSALFAAGLLSSVATATVANASGPTGQSSGPYSLNLKSTVAPVCTVSLVPTALASNILSAPINATQGIQVATLNENCNQEVTRVYSLRSTNAGFLRNPLGGASIAYVAVVNTGGGVITEGRFADGNLRIIKENFQTGAQVTPVLVLPTTDPRLLPAGEYQDTLTITIEALPVAPAVAY